MKNKTKYISDKKLDEGERRTPNLPREDQVDEAEASLIGVTAAWRLARDTRSSMPEIVV